MHEQTAEPKPRRYVYKAHPAPNALADALHHYSAAIVALCPSAQVGIVAYRFMRHIGQLDESAMKFSNVSSTRHLTEAIGNHSTRSISSKSFDCVTTALRFSNGASSHHLRPCICPF